MPTVTVADIAAVLHAAYPPETAESWDAVGLACGDPTAPVRRILLAVDPVGATVDEAVELGADLLITHHPLLLRGVHTVAADTAKGRLLHRMITRSVALLTAHTNADIADPGVSDALAARFGLRDVRPLVPTNGPADRCGHGRIGDLPAPMTVRELAAHAAVVLPTAPVGVRAAGDPDRTIRRLAVCGGAGDSFLAAATASGADAYLTGDLRHHPVSEHLEAGGPALFDVGHWTSERPWLDDVGARLGAAFATDAGADTLEILLSSRVTDPWTVHAMHTATRT